jgi:ribose/xylose/arabinose/galactoside ABC-type transport system permease subunit
LARTNDLSVNGALVVFVGVNVIVVTLGSGRFMLGLVLCISRLGDVAGMSNCSGAGGARSGAGAGVTLTP